jgi:hypothetical protein
MVTRERSRRSASQDKPERELQAWESAVEHLHDHGLPAAVPEFAAALLRKRGVHADWETAA